MSDWDSDFLLSRHEYGAQRGKNQTLTNVGFNCIQSVEMWESRANPAPEKRLSL